MRILLIEDEVKTAQYISRGLKENGYTVDISHNGKEGLFFAQEYTYDLIILDVMLPITNGWDVITAIKKDFPDIRILFLTAKDSIEDKLKGFHLGADDYLVKPFAFSELLVRIKAILRRSIEPKKDKLVLADLEVDLLKHKAKRNHKEIELTAQEFKLLVYLMENKGQVLTRTLIAESVWDIHFYTETNVIDVAIKRLRQKIDQDFDKKLIHTLRGRGYFIDES